MQHRMHIGLAIAFVLAGSARAQVPNELHFSGACNGDTNTLTLEVYDAGHRPDLVGYDLYRQPFGTCEPAVRITDVPLARDPGQHFVRQVADTGRPPNRKDAYQVVGVDANRQPVSLWQAYFYAVDRAYVGCGMAPIAHGTIEDCGWTLCVVPCAGSCYDSGFGLLDAYPSALESYVGTGIPVILYGDIGCGSVEGCLLLVDSFAEQACTVAVVPATWGTVKTTFR